MCDSSRGIYSHRLGNQWLVGGASNVGCAIFRRENYSDDELDELSLLIDPQADCRYSYYPLLRPGERFPEYDPRKMPILDPKPMVLGSDDCGDPNNGAEVLDRREYLHGLLQSIAEIESRGYSALEELGATSITEVLTRRDRADVITASTPSLSVVCAFTSFSFYSTLRRDQVFTAGGGARNEVWSAMRTRILRKKIRSFPHRDFYHHLSVCLRSYSIIRT